jgi:hypothetical protein
MHSMRLIMADNFSIFKQSKNADLTYLSSQKLL